VTNLEQHLEALEMRLTWSPFDQIGLARIVQLVNKSNQFNLTTRRYNEEELRAFIDSPDVFGFQLRLTDRFGDNGMIAVIILRKTGAEAVVDTWLMSCRVLGRKVEQASLAIIVEQMKNIGVKRLLGEYIATPKNDMVAAHYPKLGFTPIGSLDDGPVQRFTLELDHCLPWEGPIHIERYAGAKS
jgi:FkbH-like protein